MQVQIKGQTQDLRISTITLQPKVDNTVYGINCPNCSQFLTQTDGKVSKIMPYYEPTEQNLVVNKCRTCNTKYNLQTYEGYSSDTIRVVLHPTKADNDFWCTNRINADRCRILAFTEDKIFTMLDKKKHNTPFFASCYQEGCGQKYYFAEMI